MPVMRGGGGGSNPLGTAIDLSELNFSIGQFIQAMNSNVASSAYASGLPYIPLAKNATEQYVTFETLAWATGTMKLTLVYAMSASNGGDVVLEADYLKIADAGDPNAALTTQSSFTFTPGTGATRKSVGQGTQATLGLAVTANDHVNWKISRKNVGGDTHTGSLNLIGVLVTIA